MKCGRAGEEEFRESIAKLPRDRKQYLLGIEENYGFLLLDDEDPSKDDLHDQWMTW